MGYRCDVRIGTTKKGWEFIKEMAPKYYTNYIKDSEVVEEDKHTITLKDKSGWNIPTIYNKKMTLKPDIFRETKDGKYVEFGWDDIKWMGYNFFDERAYHEAMDKSGELCKEVCVGEDGATTEEYWNDTSENWEKCGDFPILEVVSEINDDEWLTK